MAAAWSRSKSKVLTNPAAVSSYTAQLLVFSEVLLKDNIDFGVLRKYFGSYTIYGVPT